MRAAIISDVHANHAALVAVLADARRQGAERTICLGDVVGYNTLASETIEQIRDRDIPCIIGNHDLMAVGELEPDACGPEARDAIYWTRNALRADERQYLGNLPGKLLLEPDAVCLHSAVDDPVIRLRTPAQFLEQREKLARMERSFRVCFTGHTHVPGIVEISGSSTVEIRRPARLELRDGSFYFVNPGSVGAPRSFDYRASYVIYDVDARTVQFRRVAYDKSSTLERNARHGIHTDMELSAGTYAMRRAVEMAMRVGARLKAAV